MGPNLRVTDGRDPLGKFVLGSHTNAIIARCKLPDLILHRSQQSWLLDHKGQKVLSNHCSRLRGSFTDRN